MTGFRPMISRRQWMGGTVKRLLITPCDILRIGPTTNEYGDAVTGLVLQVSTLVHIEELTTRFLFQTPDFIRLADLRWIVMAKWDEDIQVGDVLEINGKRFEVEGTNKEGTESRAVQKVDCHIYGTS